MMVGYQLWLATKQWKDKEGGSPGLDTQTDKHS